MADPAGAGGHRPCGPGDGAAGSTRRRPGCLERIGEHGANLDRVAGAGSIAPGAGRPGGYGRRGRPGDGAGRNSATAARASTSAGAVDMGGIGKGLALRWACARALRSLPAGAGVQIEAGGDVVAGGSPPDDGWRIGVEDPAAADTDTAAPLVVVELRSGAVATSSVRVRHWVAPDGRPCTIWWTRARASRPARG